MLDGDGQHLLLHPPGGVQHGAAGPGGRPAAAGAEEAERGQLGVAVDDPDVVEGHAHLVGGDLGQGRLVALAVGRLLR